MESTYQKVCLALGKLCEENEIPADDFEIVENFPLASLTSFKTGGNSVVVFPRTAAALAAAYPRLLTCRIPCFLLGSGTNVLAKDEGYSGVILSTVKLKNVSVSGTEICAEAGVSITALASLARKNALSGLEFAFGIPGSCGGAVFMNAGAYGGECKDVVSSVRVVFPDGRETVLSREELAFGYRQSALQENGAVVLSVVFSLQTGAESEIQEKMDDFMQRRIQKQPLEYPSAGSTFKRCEGKFTAQLIEQNGLKGARVGGAMVSEKHAGFIINFDHAKSEDIFALIEHVKKVILEKEGIRIQCEIRVIE